jgi:thioredoxin reductase
MQDVIVIGGGPAGLAAALWLARYRLRVTVVDSHNPRNAPTWAVHGYLGLEDIPPMQLREIGRGQARSAGAVLEEATAIDVTGRADDFRVHLEDGRELHCRRVLIATGLRDIIPEIPGLLDFYGSSIWHCPDCDGPSTLGQRIAVIGWGRQIAAVCMELLTWTDRITLLTHGHDPDLPAQAQAALERFAIETRRDVIDRIEGVGRQVERVVFRGGEQQPLDAIFFHIAYGPAFPASASLGCEANDDGILRVDEDFRTSVDGVYAAGDITPGAKLAIRAAADGTRAAIGIHRSLLPAERQV